MARLRMQWTESDKILVLEKIKKNKQLRYDDNMKQNLTNEEILRMAQARIIERGQTPYYPAEQHLKDTDLLMELSELIRKYK